MIVIHLRSDSCSRRIARTIILPMIVHGTVKAIDVNTMSTSIRNDNAQTYAVVESDLVLLETVLNAPRTLKVVPIS